MLRLLWILCLAPLFLACGSNIENGYVNRLSFVQGDSIEVYLNGKSQIEDGEVDIHDINGHTVASFSTPLFPQAMQAQKPYEQGFGYRKTATIPVPEVKSGIYLIDNRIPFLVRPNKPYDILILYESNTQNAYSNKGGKSLYAFNSSDKQAAPIVSFHRPLRLPFFSAKFYRWINTVEEYNIGYLCDQDMEDYANLASAKLLIIPGHSEYWTRTARKNFDRFIAEGNNALILSGNTMWWQVRYNAEGNQLICYKNQENDPITDPLLKTITWVETSLDYPVLKSIGVDYANGGFGREKDNGWNGYKIVNPSSPLLHGSGLDQNAILPLPTDEGDGTLLQFSADSTEVALQNKAQFHRYELIGYDLLSGHRPTANMAWVVLQHTPTSGVIVNTSSTDWCSKTGMKGESSATIQQLIKNMIDLLLKTDKNAAFTKP
ncbi:MAG: N,N-dimethylformamidase beta subunit family domain-containing protein [Salibacteraceae bacterium]